MAPIDLTRGAAIERFQFSVSFEPEADLLLPIQAGQEIIDLVQTAGNAIVVSDLLFGGSI